MNRFPLELRGFMPIDSVGEWSVPSQNRHYFGQTSGGWRVFKHQGDSIIQLMERADPNFISWLWRDMPFSVASPNGALRFPLVAGETGTGYISGKTPHSTTGNKKSGSNYFSLGWRVTRQHF